MKSPSHESSSGQEQNIDRFGKWARTYNSSFLQPLLFKRIHRALLSYVGDYMTSPKSILDIGCGTGILLRTASGLYPQTSLTGIDAAEEMISIAKSIPHDGRPIDYLHGTAEGLPFPDSVFDVVMTTMSFHHWSDHVVALKEIHRALKPNGLFVLADALPVGLLKSVFVPIHHGTFHSPKELEGMLTGVGLAVQRRRPLIFTGGTIQVIVAKRQ